MSQSHAIANKAKETGGNLAAVATDVAITQQDIEALLQVNKEIRNGLILLLNIVAAEGRAYSLKDLQGD